MFNMNQCLPAQQISTDIDTNEKNLPYIFPINKFEAVMTTKTSVNFRDIRATHLDMSVPQIVNQVIRSRETCCVRLKNWMC